MAKRHLAIVKRVEVKWRMLSIIRRFFVFFREKVLSCGSYVCKPSPYRHLKRSISTSTQATIKVPSKAPSIESGSPNVTDIVAIKIILLGDCRTGKTSFMMKCVGDVEEQKGLELSGVNLMDKICTVDGGGTKIVFSIWDVGGDRKFLQDIPVACGDASAILIMFDLTNRRSLNNAIGWYRDGRKHNKTAITILIGTKFDDFVQLPFGIQLTIISQARVYARAMNATLFFSSATHDINVNKIFKFITSKLFNLPWTLQRNLTLGEPIIDF